MKKSITFQILCLILFSGFLPIQAQNDIKKPSSYLEIKIDPMDLTERKLSEVSSSIRYVKLESPNNTCFEYSPKILCIDNKILLSGADPQGYYICCFDISGKFLYKIQRRGKGPGEYNQISDFLIDPLRKLIVVLDRNSGKMIRYDLKGSYVEVNIDLLMFMAFRPTF